MGIKNDLCKEYKEIAKDIRALAMEDMVECSMSVTDERTLTRNAKAMVLVHRSLDLLDAVLEKQDRIDKKLDEILRHCQD